MNRNKVEHVSSLACFPLGNCMRANSCLCRYKFNQWKTGLKLKRNLGLSISDRDNDKNGHVESCSSSPYSSPKQTEVRHEKQATKGGYIFNL